jgi:cell division protein FtsI (penicillin-binding protein 3)
VRPGSGHGDQRPPRRPDEGGRAQAGRRGTGTQGSSRPRRNPGPRGGGGRPGASAAKPVRRPGSPGARPGAPAANPAKPVPRARNPGARYQAPPQARAALARPVRVLRRAGPARRLTLSLACIAVVLTVFAGRLVQLQGLDGSQYQALAEQQIMRQEPIQVVRGSIVSSDGTVLAMTVQTDLVYADPVLIHQAQRPAVAAALAGRLRMSRAAIQALLNRPSSPEYVVLKQSVPATTGAQIMALNLPGIDEKASYTRVYPNGDLAANLIGFTDTDAAGDLRGEAGLEQEYNSLLAGRDGTQEVGLGPTEQPIPQTAEDLQAPVPAGSLQLTIQADIQWEAEQACAAEVKVARAADCSVVVMQPSTGQILALAQYPTFDPSAPASEAATTDIPVEDVFQPGSTAKVITVAAALEHGGQTPLSTYIVPDSIVVDGFQFHDSESHPTAPYTIAGIVANSLNDGMVQVVQHVSPQIQYQYLRAFGLGQPTGLGLPGESGGILPPPSEWWGDERYTLSFGQGVAVTAVQMASVYATIANGGVRVQPSLVAGTTDGGTFRPAPAPRRTRVIQPRTASELMSILEQVPAVDASAGEPWGVIPGYSIAAKTGTSQEAAPGQSCLCEYGSSYIGIAPATSPQLVVAVNVQDPRSGSYFGDAVAGPVFYQVMKFALQTLRIPPDGGKRPDVRLMG